MAEGDPSGNYNFEEFIEGKFIKHFPFTVGHEIAPSFSSQSDKDMKSGKSTDNDFQKFSESVKTCADFVKKFKTRFILKSIHNNFLSLFTHIIIMPY